MSLSAADIHVVSLLARVEGLLVPSKFYGVAAAGRATCFIGRVDGEIGTLVSANTCGVAIAEGDALAFSETLLAWSHNPALVEEMGINARRMLVEKFSWAIARRNWLSRLSAFGALDPDRLVVRPSVVD